MYYHPNKADHYSFFSSTARPLAFNSSRIRSSLIVIPWICSSMLKEIDTNSIFLGEGVVVSMVLTKVFKANPNPSSKVKSSLYSCLRNELAAM